jgi:glyceraldehyde 3-phosphate dehydrogenase
MTIRVGINGFGRIGREYMRYAADSTDIEVVAINDVFDVATLARLLRHDSTFGPFRKEVDVQDDTLVIDGRKVAVSAIREPRDLPWAEHNVDIVIESTGKFRTREAAAAHLTAGASRVLVSAPGKGLDATIVMGVNDGIYDPQTHRVISNASCTTNCVAPMVKVLHDAFGIERGFMTTVHAYTNDQNILDAPHKDPRRARSAAVNIIPTTTGAARAVGEVLPELKGKLDGSAIRVPVPDVSLIDLTFTPKRDTSRDEVNQILKAASQTERLRGILDYTDEPVVSIDLMHTSASSTVDSLETAVLEGKLVRVLSWYDNEWGFSNRMVDTARAMAKLG